MKIITEYWAKPIPDRNFDWCAYRDGDEPNDNGQMPHGFGATRRDAVKDLGESLNLRLDIDWSEQEVDRQIGEEPDGTSIYI